MLEPAVRRNLYRRIPIDLQGDTARRELEQPQSVTIEATEDAAGRLLEHVK